MTTPLLPSTKTITLRHPDGKEAPHGAFVHVVPASRTHGIFLGLGYREEIEASEISARKEQAEESADVPSMRAKGKHRKRR